MEQYLDKLAKAPPAQKYGGIAGAVVALTALTYFFAISDLDEKIERQARQKRQLEVELAQKTADANNLNELLREMEQLETKLAEALTEMPEQKDIDELLTQLTDIGRRSGLEIMKVEPVGENADPQHGQLVNRLPIRMVVSGNYHEIALFMQEVANLRRIVSVQDIKLGQPKMRNDKVVLDTEFLATAFRFIPKSPAAQ
jgi:type IV pilus assembly protein PilO